MYFSEPVQGGEERALTREGNLGAPTACSRCRSGHLLSPHARALTSDPPTPPACPPTRLQQLPLLLEKCCSHIHKGRRNLPDLHVPFLTVSPNIRRPGPQRPTEGQLVPNSRATLSLSAHAPVCPVCARSIYHNPALRSVEVVGSLVQRVSTKPAPSRALHQLLGKGPTWVHSQWVRSLTGRHRAATRTPGDTDAPVPTVSPGLRLQFKSNAQLVCIRN